MYDFRINLNEEDEAKEQIIMLQKHCKFIRDDLAYEYIKGFIAALQNYRDRYQTGFTQTQILYIGYHMYKWLMDRHTEV